MTVFAQAMERAVLANCGKNIQRTSRWLRFPAFWRDGKDCNVSLDLENGYFMDWATNTRGGAKEFAALIGADWRAFMAGLSFVERPPPPPPVERTGVQDLWERLLDHDAQEPAPDAIRWLEDERRIPQAMLIDSGFALLDASNVHCFDLLGRLPHDRGGMGGWAGWRLDRAGPCLLAPVRDMMSGAVVNLQVRPLKGGERRWIPGCFISPPTAPAPRAYGFAHKARTARVVIVCEGWFDTVAVELFVRDRLDTVVVGATSANTVQHFAGILATARAERIVLVPQLDTVQLPPKPSEQSQRAFGRLAGTLDRMESPCTILDWDRLLPPDAPTDVKHDIGTLLEQQGFERTKAAFLEAIA